MREGVAKSIIEWKFLRKILPQINADDADQNSISYLRHPRLSAANFVW
jgi:hypothetical protein